jgi:hypothetical protein
MARGGDAVEYGQAIGPGDALEEALKALEGMNQKNWKKIRDVVAGHIQKSKDWFDGRVVREG